MADLAGGEEAHHLIDGRVFAGEGSLDVGERGGGADLPMSVSFKNLLERLDAIERDEGWVADVAFVDEDREFGGSGDEGRFWKFRAERECFMDGGGAVPIAGCGWGCGNSGDSADRCWFR